MPPELPAVGADGGEVAATAAAALGTGVWARATSVELGVGVTEADGLAAALAEGEGFGVAVGRSVGFGVAAGFGAAAFVTATG
jgi:hypothetical protein